jgi:hypothetical protein
VLLPAADRKARCDLDGGEGHAGVGQLTKDGRARRLCFGVAGGRLAPRSAVGSRRGGGSPSQGNRL